MMDPALMYHPPAMTPIPEEGEYHLNLRTDQQVQRELYRSEKVETSSRTVAENELDSITNRQEQFDPGVLGPPDHTSSSYSYTYESTTDPPVMQNGDGTIETTFGDNGVTEVERQSYSTQKVTKMTKVTTTRTIEQTPVDGDGVAYDGIPAPAPLSGDYPEPVPNYDAVPSAPSTPQLIDVDVDQVTLAWLIPKYDGTAGPVEGYVVECRLPTQGQPDWLPAHDGLINDTQVTVCGLQPYGEYEFRIVGRNPAGLGEPGPCTPLIKLTPRRETRLSSTGQQPPMYPESSVPYPPGRPQVVDMDGSSVQLSWEPPIETGQAGPLMGYYVEYRSAAAPDWLLANDHYIAENRYTVRGLRPNGDYEFRVLGKNADGNSLPSQSTGLVKVKPSVPLRLSPSPFNLPHQGAAAPTSSSYIPAPCQPQVAFVDSDAVTLFWPPPIPKEEQRGRRRLMGYYVECREIGDPTWFAATDRVLQEPQIAVVGLRPNSTYEFRVFAKGTDGWSEPSEVTDMVQLRPRSSGPPGNRSAPARPGAPEVYACVDDTVTLCWAPARSVVPVQGYQVELRDSSLGATWYPVNQILTSECKLTVSNLEFNHEYVFRVTAKNAIGYSEPSPSSQAVVPGHTYIAEGFQDPAGGPPPPAPLMDRLPSTEHQLPDGSPTIPEEMRVVRESPPITDTDDSPPPIRRHPQGEGVQWRDPTLPEVIDYLDNSNQVVRCNAAGYLQHLTYSDPSNKQRTHELNGIPRLVALLRESNSPELLKNACGCLRNLSFGRENDELKVAIMEANGVRELARVLDSVSPTDNNILEEVTGTLWNLSSCDNLKRTILDQASQDLIRRIIIPYAGLDQPKGSRPSSKPVFFRNACGVLRNVSSAGEAARRSLRLEPRFIECLLTYLSSEVGPSYHDIEDKAIENIVCILRNLSYRCQEVIDPNYDSNPPSPYERSKSAPSGSPKGKPKKDKKKGDKLSPHGDEDLSKIPAGMALLWQPEAIKTYLDVLRGCSNPETLEAAAGAIQNLAACYWSPSVQVRTELRLKKGLPILVELLRVDVDRVVSAVATALRNLAIDVRNRDLIGQYAMLDLVRKLPARDERPAFGVSDVTICAVLGVIYETVSLRPDSGKSDGSTQYARSFHEKKGTDRLIWITRERQMFSPRVVKYAAQVLFVLWQQKELHDLYRSSGYREADFVSRVVPMPNRGADTLSRPRGTQGTVSSDQPRSASKTPSQPRYGSMDPRSQDVVDMKRLSLKDGAKTPTGTSVHEEREPLYAQVRKGRPQTSTVNGSEAPYDSWV